MTPQVALNGFKTEGLVGFRGRAAPHLYIRWGPPVNQTLRGALRLLPLFHCRVLVCKALLTPPAPETLNTNALNPKPLRPPGLLHPLDHSPKS